MKRCTTTLLAAVLATILVGCSNQPALSPPDAAALETLAQIVGPTSDVDPATITSTECWLPSEHLLKEESVSTTTWRILCRAHYTDSNGGRYQDATCVGDFDAEPMLDHCYRWVYYTGMPRFEDHPGVKAG